MHWFPSIDVNSAVTLAVTSEQVACFLLVPRPLSPSQIVSVADLTQDSRCVTSQTPFQSRQGLIIGPSTLPTNMPLLNSHCFREGELNFRLSRTEDSVTDSPDDVPER